MKSSNNYVITVAVDWHRAAYIRPLYNLNKKISRTLAVSIKDKFLRINVFILTDCSNFWKFIFHKVVLRRSCGMAGYLITTLFQIFHRVWQWKNFENLSISGEEWRYGQKFECDFTDHGV